MTVNTSDNGRITSRISNGFAGCDHRGKYKCTHEVAFEMKQDPSSWRLGRARMLLDRLRGPAVRYITTQRERRPADPGAAPRGQLVDPICRRCPAPADISLVYLAPQGRCMPCSTLTNRH